MKNTLLTTITFLTIVLHSYGQKQNIEYKPILGTSIEEAFPLATQKIMKEYNLSIGVFDYNKGILESEYFEYTRGLLGICRGRWFVSINESGTLTVKISDIQSYVSEYKRWEDSGESFLFKKELKLCIAFTEQLQSKLSDSHEVNEAKQWFFTNLEINSLFYENATNLAGDRWFENNLKDKKIEWNLIFGDIDKNERNDGYKYKEVYVYGRFYKLGILPENRFYITKYTNSDANAFVNAGTNKNVSGYCRSLLYENDKFYIVLTDNLEDATPNNSLAASQNNSAYESNILELAKQLKQLKELLDLGAITQEEYDAEKSKLLNK